jgi:hypothetical protein
MCILPNFMEICYNIEIYDEDIKCDVFNCCGILEAAK